MSLATAHLGLGSNVGQRLKQMRSAIELLSAEGVATIATSPVYENRAIGMGSEADPFLNAVIEVQTVFDPEALLEICQTIEAKLGRVRSQAWSPRTIDIDIITYGQLQVETEKLHLPHPRIAERDFVLQPFADIAPDFELHGKSIRVLLKELPAVELTRIADKLV